MPNTRASGPGSTTLFAWLLAAALPAFFLCLGANSIWDANEAFYVDTPRQMVQSGDYITPVFNGTERINKPVLSYWIVAGLYQLFGSSVEVERLGIALGAMGIIAATFMIGRAFRSTLAGLIAALIVATAPRMIMFSRRIFIDIYITLFMALALACFVLAERHPALRRRYLMLMYVALGLGVLTKGPVAIVLPAAVCLIWLVVERRLGDVRRLMLLPGILIVTAIVVPWYAALYVQHGWGPIWQFFVGENVERYTSAMVPGSRGIFFYLPVLFGDLFPWAPLLLVPIVSGWRSRTAGEGVTEASLRRLLWIWIVTIVAAFSLSQTKQDLYIFPVVPAVAVLVAGAFADFGFGRDHRGLRLLLAIVGLLTAAAGGVSYWLFSAGYYALDGIGAVTATLVAGGLASAGLVVSGRHRQSMAALAATFVIFNYLFVAWVLPGVERLKPSGPLAREIAMRAGPEGRVGAFNLLFPSLVYYLGRPVQEIGDVSHASLFFTEGEDAWVIMSDESYQALGAEIPGLCVVARRPLFEAKLEDLITRQPPSDVLLVSNRCGATN